MKRDDDPELWDLLGHAAEPEITPFFARNVVREIRKPSRRHGFLDRFHLSRAIPATGVATVLLTVLFLRWSMSVSPLPNGRLETTANAEALETEVITDLEDLLAVDDNSSPEEAILL